MAVNTDVQDSVSGTLVATVLNLLAGDKMVRVIFTGTYTGSQGTLQGSYDGTNYVNISAMREDTGGMVTGTIDIGATNASLIANVSGWTRVRFNPTQVSSGTSTCRLVGGSRFELPLGATAISISSIASTITSTSANALVVGRQGTTDPVLKVDASAATVATGIKIAGAAAASGVAIAAISSGTDESLSIDAKGSGEIGLNATGTGDIVLNRATRIKDDLDIMLGTGEDAVLRFSTGDADNNCAVLGLDDASQQLHVTDKGAVATDWNISATTHPNVYIHSNTTPATNYLRIGSHDGTTVDIDVVGGTTGRLCRAGTAEYTWTASQFNVLDGNSLCVGATALLTTSAAATAQVLGTAAADSMLLVGCASTTDATHAEIAFLKSGNAALGSNTIVANSEDLGSIVWYADDGTDYATPAASIRAVVNGTPGANDMPAALIFSTTPDSTNAVADRMLIDQGGQVLIGDTTNATVTIGLTINQGAADNSILEFKSSDVSHTGTGVTEADTYGKVSKWVANNGGLFLMGIDDTADQGIVIRGVGSTATATRSTAGTGPIMLSGSLITANNPATVGADKNLLVVRDLDTTRFVLDSDGDSFQDVGTAWTNFDDHDDLTLLNSMSKELARPGNAIGDEFGGWLKANKGDLERLNLVHFNEDTDGRPFVNMSKLTMLLTGAVRQLGLQFAELKNQVNAALPAAKPVQALTEVKS